ncbi:hypothetical protein KKG16_00615 [Patescibacteria group bacterium]|nr:hypothetical protein [Patescibacteria group bacterium]
MSESPHSLGQWIEAANKGETPSGQPVAMPPEVLQLGDEIDITYDGWQHFGSGGFSASATFVGSEPEFVSELPDAATSFITKKRGKFRITGPVLICISEGDRIGEGRSSRRVLVCREQ